MLVDQIQECSLLSSFLKGSLTAISKDCHSSVHPAGMKQILILPFDNLLRKGAHN